MIFVAEIYAAIDPEGTESRLLFGTDSWHTGSGGSPANTPVYGRLLQPANFERSIASGKMIFGLTEAGYGECTIANADGAFDVLTTYGVSGRDFRLWACEPTTSAFTFEHSRISRAGCRSSTPRCSRSWATETCCAFACASSSGR